jgi:hypothetical protein
MAEYDDDVEVERRVRASLDLHAEEVDTSVSLRIGRSYSHRRRWLALAAVAAAAVAIAAITVPVVVLGDHGRQPARLAAVDAPTDWRTEYWRGISVQVPVGWAWGGGPMRQGRQTVRCTETAVGTPYIGRPIGQSDVCWLGRLEPAPTAPYVWVDAPIEPGATDVGNGYVQETVERDGITVTVGSDDQTLRERILSSVASQRLCPSTVSPEDPSLVRMPIDGTGELESFHLCAYSPDSGGSYELVYGRMLDSRSYDAFREASDEAPQGSARCTAPPGLVVLTATSDDLYGDEPVTRTWVADVGCELLTSTAGQFRLTERAIDTWADQGLRWTLPAFIGYLG